MLNDLDVVVENDHVAGDLADLSVVDAIVTLDDHLSNDIERRSSRTCGLERLNGTLRARRALRSQNDGLLLKTKRARS